MRDDSGFCAVTVKAAARSRGAHYILVARLDQKLQILCRHEDACWQSTDLAGMEVQEVVDWHLGERLIVIRQRIAERPEAGGKTLLDVPGYRFQALVTSLPTGLTPLAVWRHYNGRADNENRLKEPGREFGVRGLCCREILGDRSGAPAGDSGVQPLRPAAT